MTEQVLYSHDDVITSISVSGLNSNQFITTSLDGVVNLYDFTHGIVLQSLQTVPILDSTFHNRNFYLSCVDGTVRCIDLESGKSSVVGEVFSKGLCCIVSTGDKLISGSWDKQVQIFNTDSGDIEMIDVPEKVVAMVCDENKLVVAMTDRIIYVYDLHTYKLLQKRESGLKYQIRSMSCFNEGFALSSIEGKVSIEYYDNTNNYAFRCHRQKDLVNSVNCCLVRNLKLYTAGDDGTISVWDYHLKKKIKTFTFSNHRLNQFVILNNSTLIAVSEGEVYTKSI